QPWMLWTQRPEKPDFPPSPPDGKAYHLVNVATGKERCVIEAPVQMAALSADGKYLAVVERDTPARVALWDAETGKKVSDLGDHKHAIESLAFAPDGKVLAAGSAHTARDPGEIKLWDLAARKEKASAEVQGTCTKLQFVGAGDARRV